MLPCHVARLPAFSNMSFGPKLHESSAIVCTCARSSTDAARGHTILPFRSRSDAYDDLGPLRPRAHGEKWPHPGLRLVARSLTKLPSAKSDQFALVSNSGYPASFDELIVEANAKSHQNQRTNQDVFCHAFGMGWS